MIKQVKTMMKEEFVSRAIEVSDEEFDVINELYMNSDLDKDEFCKQWCEMNKKRVDNYKKLENWIRRRYLICDFIGGIDCAEYKRLSEEPALKILSKIEIAALKLAEIEVHEWTNMGDVIYEVRRYIRTF